MGIGLALCLLATSPAPSVVDQLEQLAPQLDNVFAVPLNAWRFSPCDLKGAELRNADDRGGQTVSPGFSWVGENSRVWFRTRFVLPARVAGQPTASP